MVLFLQFHNSFFHFFLGKKNVIVCFGIRHGSGFHLIRIEPEGSNAPGILAVPVRFRLAVRSEADIGVLENVVLEVHHGPLAPDEHQRVAVIQHTHLVGGHKLSPRQLPVGGVAAAPALGLAIGVGVDCLLAQQLGNILVGGL